MKLCQPCQSVPEPGKRFLFAQDAADLHRAAGGDGRAGRGDAHRPHELGVLDLQLLRQAHQGVVAVAAVKEYCTIADILAAAEEQAASITASAHTEADNARAEAEEIKKAAGDYRGRFLRLLPQKAAAVFESPYRNPVARFQADQGLLRQQSSGRGCWDMLPFLEIEGRT